MQISPITTTGDVEDFTDPNAEFDLFLMISHLVDEAEELMYRAGQQLRFLNKQLMLPQKKYNLRELHINLNVEHSLTRTVALVSCAVFFYIAAIAILKK